MGKFQYEDEGGSGFLTKAEKEVLIEEGTVFPVTAVTDPYENEYKGKVRLRRNVVIDLEGEPKKLGFALGDSNGDETSRDRELAALATFFAEDPDPEPPLYFLERVGQFVRLVQADSE
jgi:hypothetical protein